MRHAPATAESLEAEAGAEHEHRHHGVAEVLAFERLGAKTVVPAIEREGDALADEPAGAPAKVQGQQLRATRDIRFRPARGDLREPQPGPEIAPATTRPEVQGELRHEAAHPELAGVDRRADGALFGCPWRLRATDQQQR